MGADKVPAPDFMRRTDEADVEDTTKKAILDFPSTALHEAISATILRIAKEKFESRPWEEDELDDASLDGEVSDVHSDETNGSDSQSDRPGARSRSIPRPIKREGGTGGEGTGKQPQNSEENINSPKEGYLRPSVATDDDISYTLLRPSVRHILSKLDDTLDILHIFQDSTMDYLSDSVESDASASSHFSHPSSREGQRSGMKGKRGRPRKDGTASASRRSEPISGTDDQLSKKTGQPSTARPSTQSDALGDKKGKKTKRGRPKKTYERLQDESEREYAIRIARLQKKPIPTFADLDSGAEAGRESEEENVTKTPRSNSKSKRTVTKELSPERPKTKKVPGDRWKSSAKPRDWRNVLGAAMLAGFPPEAVDRAARRCADLFGQSMEFHTLTEGPVGQTDAVKTTRYVPGMPRPPLLESEDEEPPPPKTRYGTRGSSTAADATSTGERGSSYGHSGSAAQPNSMRSRSRSASVAGSYFCTFGDCPRATEGFSRRQNLLRHLKLVHGFEGDSIPVEVDSEDEMYGGVHVDGFLKPIKIRPGWRSNDLGEEPRKRKRGRPRKGSMSGTDGGGAHALDSYDGEAEEGRGSEEW